MLENQRIVSGKTETYAKLTRGIHISKTAAVFLGGPRRGDPAMTAKMVTTRTKGNPRLYVEGKGWVV